MRNSRSFQSQNGFSYIGLLIMIMIIGAASASILTSGSAIQRKGAEDELLFVGEQFQVALRSYYDATPVGTRPYPSQLGDLLHDPRFPTVRRHLRRIYADPMTGTGDWGIVEAPGGGIIGINSRSTETPIRTTGFGDHLAVFEGATKYSDWVFALSLPVR